VCTNAEESIDEWTRLYANLVARHDIRGIAVFSGSSFARQSSVPGALIVRATHRGETVGMTWWYVHGDVAYYHLGAYSDTGYALRASFALFWRAIEYFADRQLRWLDIGAGAGLGGAEEDGLSRFKSGWATGRRTAYLCGRVFDRPRYQEIVQVKEGGAHDYFPAYRHGEFG
jgi:GNAT acetyltransferase-like protein